MKKQNNSQITDRNDLEQLAVEWETFSTEYAAALAEKTGESQNSQKRKIKNFSQSIPDFWKRKKNMQVRS